MCGLQASKDLKMRATQCCLLKTLKLFNFRKIRACLDRLTQNALNGKDQKQNNGRRTTYFLPNIQDCGMTERYIKHFCLLCNGCAWGQIYPKENNENKSQTFLVFQTCSLSRYQETTTEQCNCTHPAYPPLRDPPTPLPDCDFYVNSKIFLNKFHRCQVLLRAFIGQPGRSFWEFETGDNFVIKITIQFSIRTTPLEQNHYIFLLVAVFFSGTHMDSCLTTVYEVFMNVCSEMSCWPSCQWVSVFSCKGSQTAVLPESNGLVSLSPWKRTTFEVRWPQETKKRVGAVWPNDWMTSARRQNTQKKKMPFLCCALFP